LGASQLETLVVTGNITFKGNVTFLGTVTLNSVNFASDVTITGNLTANQVVCTNANVANSVAVGGAQTATTGIVMNSNALTIGNAGVSLTQAGLSGVNNVTCNSVLVGNASLSSNNGVSTLVVGASELTSSAVNVGTVNCTSLNAASQILVGNSSNGCGITPSLITLTNSQNSAEPFQIASNNGAPTITNLANLVVDILNISFECLVGSYTTQQCILMTTYANADGLPCGYIVVGPYNSSSTTSGYIVLDGRIPTIQCVHTKTDTAPANSICASYFYGAEFVQN
jgi:hypothetical protein